AGQVRAGLAGAVVVRPVRAMRSTERSAEPPPSPPAWEGAMLRGLHLRLRAGRLLSLAAALAVALALLIAGAGWRDATQAAGRASADARVRGGLAAAAIDTSTRQYGAHSLLIGALTNTQRTAILDSAQAAGAGWIRLSLGWRLINPSQGTFTYTAVDKLVSGA